MSLSYNVENVRFLSTQLTLLGLKTNWKWFMLGRSNGWWFLANLAAGQQAVQKAQMIAADQKQVVQRWVGVVSHYQAVVASQEAEEGSAGYRRGTLALLLASTWCAARWFFRFSFLFGPLTTLSINRAYRPESFVLFFCPPNPMGINLVVQARSFSMLIINCYNSVAMNNPSVLCTDCPLYLCLINAVSRISWIYLTYG